MVVKELLEMRVPPILILVCLLTLWNTQMPHSVDRDFLELFSGQAEVTRALRAANLHGCAMDVAYDERIYDLTSPSGFTLALNEVLRCREGALLVLAPCCKSFSRMSRHTSGRTFLCPYGLQWHDFVGVGNILATRCILLVLVASWRKLRWILEQPLGSCMEDPPRFQWHYPRPFGEFMAAQAIACCTVTVNAEFHSSAPSICLESTDVELFRQHCMPLGKTDLWSEARMMDVIGYLGPCKHMEVSGGWEAILHELFLR